MLADTRKEYVRTKVFVVQYGSVQNVIHIKCGLSKRSCLPVILRGMGGKCFIMEHHFCPQNKYVICDGVCYTRHGSLQIPFIASEGDITRMCSSWMKTVAFMDQKYGC